ncbi:uncharacterized protein ARB_04781 [Trichophyton benhamiae CBS 112371]|uniref:Uncharacterized protein n=1 Tax=Arthroderma benhamiae (strain ATCC MYA-4681 / CBS 112371) TaxID=663331 RepID=D4AM91_ARTBC|nr:uncharacterized protein ARB_04781 [Trichophyton benhamiae CBS 112371]EFE35847.1 hypothetical protein ARB_04781 [Trichophyton benhamiae CBS 112371]
MLKIGAVKGFIERASYLEKWGQQVKTSNNGQYLLVDEGLTPEIHRTGPWLRIYLILRSNYCNAASVMPVTDSQALSLFLNIMRWQHSFKLSPQTATYLIGATLGSVTGGSLVYQLGRQWTRRLVVIVNCYTS